MKKEDEKKKIPSDACDAPRRTDGGVSDGCCEKTDPYDDPERCGGTEEKDPREGGGTDTRGDRTREGLEESLDCEGEKTSRFLRLGRIFTRERVLALARGAGLLVLAFLLDRCEWFLGAHPFGIALLCAAEGGLGWIYGGALLSALPLFGAVFRPISIVVCTAVVLLRVAVRMTVDLPWKRGEDPGVRSFSVFCGALFREHVALRMTVAAVGAFLVGLYGMIGGGYRVYDLLSSLFLMAVAPAAAFVLSGLWRRGVSAMRSARDLLTVVLSLGIIVLSLFGVYFYRVSLGVFAALGITLWITYRKGISVGILTGLLLGLAIDPVSAPLYGFAAISAGALKRVSVFMGALSALSVGMAWGFYVYGLGALSGLFPALLSAALLFCVLERIGFLPTCAEPEGPPEEDDALPTRGMTTAEAGGMHESLPEDGLSVLRSSLAAERLRDEERRIEDLCGAFLSVSDLLRALRENGKYPSVEELRRVCDRVCDEFCPACVSCAKCWGSEYAQMTGVLGRIAEDLHRNGRASADAFPEEVRARCKMSGAIFLRINEEAGALSAAALKREKAGILSADYGAAASLFRSASRFAPEEYGIDERKSLEADRFLRACGVYPSRVAVSGGRRGCLYAWNVDRESAECVFADEDVRAELAQALGFMPATPILTPIPGGGGLCDLRAPATPRYRVRGTSVSRCACRDGREEGLCGDSVSLFESGDGRSFALLSDGMGSGRDAAHLSGICTVFLQKMLSTGGETGLILRMLNDFLSAGALGESSATVDLLDFDLYTGEGAFWKSGAAPTFVFREGNLFRLSARTAPAGILAEADVQKTLFRLYPGDTVVMLSDGVADGNGDCDFLETMLSGVESDEELRRAAEHIVDGARSRFGRGEDLDDRSVILLRIEAEEASREEARIAG